VRNEGDGNMAIAAGVVAFLIVFLLDLLWRLGW
jgi:hypothetical protein